MACKLINGNAMKVSNNFFKGHDGKKFNCCFLLLKGFQTSNISYSTFIKKYFKKNSNTEDYSSSIIFPTLKLLIFRLLKIFSNKCFGLKFPNF